jgi:CheY-like chemotaxis protein
MSSFWAALSLYNSQAFMSDERHPGPIVVLVVESDPVICLAGVTMLSGEGFKVLEAPDTWTALAMLEVEADRMHALFADAGLPGTMDGCMLAQHVRQRWPWISLLVTSGLIGVDGNTMPEGARFFTKPYDLRDIADHIRLTAATTPSA